MIIDRYKNGSYYQREPGGTEAAKMDCSTFSCSADKSGTYYANSIIHDGVSYRVFDLDEGVLLWDKDIYYRME